MVDEKNSDEMNLSNMKLRKIPKRLQTLQNIKSVDLANNLIQNIDNLCDNIEYLSVFNNYIEILENIPSHCIYLTAEYNNITKIKQLPKSLQMIYLYGNPIYHIIEKMDIATIIWYSRFEIDTLPTLKKILIDDIYGIIASYFKLQTSKQYFCCENRKKLL